MGPAGLGEGEAFDAPLTVTFARADPDPPIQIHRYGVFEDHLDPGEEVEAAGPFSRMDGVATSTHMNAV